MLALLDLYHPFGFPYLFASLHTYLYVHVGVLVLACVIKPNSYYLV